MKSDPVLPAEFFQPEELRALAGTPQRSRVIAWLVERRIHHHVGRHGWPIVYRNGLLQTQPESPQNEQPAFDFIAARASRTSKTRRQP